MSFEAYLAVNDRTATVHLSGELDVATAPVFRSLIEQAGAQGARRLVLQLGGLTYMSSAGLRCLVFAQQTMGPDVEIVLVDGSPEVLEVVHIAGFDTAVTIAGRSA